MKVNVRKVGFDQVGFEQEVLYRWWLQSEPHLQQCVANQFSFGSKWSSYAEQNL